MSTVWAIVVAAGTGQRYGRAKQFDLLGGRPLIDWAVSTAASTCDGVCLVVSPGVLEAAAADRSALAGQVVVGGGSTRTESVSNGLAALPDDADIVVVHDAARPLAPPSLFDDVVTAVRAGADAAIPGLPVVDTVKRIRETPSGRVVQETLDRETLVLVQTPQAFRRAALEGAHSRGGEATDDAALVEAAGGLVAVVDGHRLAHKVTRPSDLADLERWSEEMR